MAKIQVDVAVNSAAFAAFFDVFQQYRKAAEDMPDQWKSIGKQTSEAKQNFAEAADSIRKLADNMDEVLRSQRSLGNAAASTSQHFMAMARDTRDVAKNILSATTQLLKWAGITGIISGLTGYGALYGINTLASSVASNRSDAMGLNTTYGGLQSFRVNMQRFVDPESFLGRVAGAQQDVSKRNSLRQLGISNEDIDHGQSDDVGTKAILAFKDVVDKLDDSSLANQLHARGLDNLFSIDEARRIKRSSRKEVEDQANAERKDKNALSVGPDIAKQWQDLSTQLGRAESEIESLFVTSLVRIEPGILQLSNSFVKIVQALAKEDGPIDHWLGELNEGLKYLAENIDKPEFHDEVVGFIDMISQAGKSVLVLGQSLAKMIAFLAGLIGSDAEAKEVPPPPPGFDDGTNAPGGGGHYGGRRGFMGRGGGGGGNVDPSKFTGATGKWWTPDRVQHAVDRLMKEGGLSQAGAEGLVARWAAVEAAGGPTSRNPKSGALGIAQWLGSRKRDFTADFDSQLTHAIDEGKHAEKAAWEKLKRARNEREGAIGASSYERAEHYNAQTGTDDWTGKSMAAAKRIHQMNAARATHSTTIKTTSKPGSNPSITTAKAAAPP